MTKRLICPLLAATALWAALGGGATPASAAIRVVIYDGTNTRVFYSSANSALFNATLPTFESLLGVSSATESSSSTSLGQTLLVTDVANGALPISLTVTTSVINAVGGVPDGLVTGVNEAAVLGAGLALFTLPSAPALLVGSDTDGNSNLATGTIQNNTTVNGVLVPSLAIPIDGLSPPDAQQTGVAFNSPTGFTLVSQIVLTGASQGIVGSIASSSTVSALTPEPGPLVLWGLGALGIVVAAARRRFQTQAAG
jgi:hypothetical protein